MTDTSSAVTSEPLASMSPAAMASVRGRPPVSFTTSSAQLYSGVSGDRSSMPELASNRDSASSVSSTSKATCPHVHKVVREGIEGQKVRYMIRRGMFKAYFRGPFSEKTSNSSGDKSFTSCILR